MIISVATPEQLPIIRELAYLIWPVTYGHILSKKQFDYMMEMMYSLDSLNQQLDNDKVFLLVADGVNYVGFASYEININNTNKTKIHKLYVLPETQGKGIGRMPIDYIKQLAISHANTALELTVNRFNSAKEFYLKYGFEVVAMMKFDIGRGHFMDDYVMEMKL